MTNHELEAHLKTHNEIQPFFCDMCDKKFYSKWRLEKHISGHNINKFCHYYNNQKFCPYEEIGYKFRHEVSAFCLSSMCTNLLCQYSHSDNQIMMKDIVGNEEYGDFR